MVDRERDLSGRLILLVVGLALAAAACGSGGGGGSSPGAAGSPRPAASSGRGDYGVGSSSAPTASATASTASSAPASSDGAAIEVDIVSFSFSPGELTVSVGSTVTWTNRDGAPHTATADDGSFSSERLGGGSSFSHTFSAAGRYAYHCAVHPSMIAVVVVSP